MPRLKIIEPTKDFCNCNVRVFQAQRASPALSHSLWIRRGTNLLLPDSTSALPQRVRPHPALQGEPAALSGVRPAPHRRRAAARPASATRVCPTRMSLIQLIALHVCCV